MNQQFVIDQRLPGLNEVIAANRKNPHAGANLKKVTDYQIGACIWQANLKPVAGRCIVHMTFVEGNRRRDVDNVESAKKFILDALVEQGVLQGDSPRYVTATPSYTRYGTSDKVIVTIVEEDAAELFERVERAYAAICGEASE